MDSLVGLIEFLIGAVVVLAIVFVALLVVVSRMPHDNPLRRVLNLLLARVGFTAAAGLVAIPITPIPGLDVMYDLAVPVALAVYWFTFFRNAARVMRGPRPLGPVAGRGYR